MAQANGCGDGGIGKGGTRTYQKHVGFLVEGRRFGVLLVADDDVLVLVGDGIRGDQDGDAGPEPGYGR